MFHGIMMSYPVKQSRKRFFILPSGARWGCNDIPIVQGGQGDAEATICFPASAYLGEGEKLTLIVKRSLFERGIVLAGRSSPS